MTTTKNIFLVSNPVNALLDIQIKDVNNSNIDFQILDISGKIMLEHKHKTTGDLELIHISVEKLPSGTYFLKGIVNGDIQSLKFTKI